MCIGPRSVAAAHTVGKREIVSKCSIIAKTCSRTTREMAHQQLRSGCCDGQCHSGSSGSCWGWTASHAQWLVVF